MNSKSKGTVIGTLLTLAHFPGNSASARVSFRICEELHRCGKMRKIHSLCLNCR